MSKVILALSATFALLSHQVTLHARLLKRANGAFTPEADIQNLIDMYDQQHTEETIRRVYLEQGRAFNPAFDVLMEMGATVSDPESAAGGAAAHVEQQAEDAVEAEDVEQQAEVEDDVEQQAEDAGNGGGALLQVGAAEPIDSLRDKEGRSNQNIRRQCAELETQFQGFRVIRGDGNCYYRSILFGILELAVIRERPDLLVNLQALFEQNDGAVHNVSEFLNDWAELIIRDVSGSPVGEQRDRSKSVLIDRIQSAFNENPVMDKAFTNRFRSTVANYVRDNAVAEIHGLPISDIATSQGISLEQFVNDIILRDGVCAEGIAVIMTEKLLENVVHVQNVMLDRNLEEIQLPEPGVESSRKNPENTVFILFKPGHYDLLVPAPDVVAFPQRVGHEFVPEECAVPAPEEVSQEPHDGFNTAGAGAPDSTVTAATAVSGPAHDTKASKTKEGDEEDEESSSSSSSEDDDDDDDDDAHHAQKPVSAPQAGGSTSPATDTPAVPPAEGECETECPAVMMQRINTLLQDGKIDDAKWTDLVSQCADIDAGEGAKLDEFESAVANLENPQRGAASTSKNVKTGDSDSTEKGPGAATSNKKGTSTSNKKVPGAATVPGASSKGGKTLNVDLPEEGSDAQELECRCSGFFCNC